MDAIDISNEVHTEEPATEVKDDKPIENESINETPHVDKTGKIILLRDSLVFFFNVYSTIL